MVINYLLLKSNNATSVSKNFALPVTGKNEDAGQLAAWCQTFHDRPLSRGKSLWCLQSCPHYELVLSFQDLNIHRNKNGGVPNYKSHRHTSCHKNRKISVNLVNFMTGLFSRRIFSNFAFRLPGRERSS